MIFARPGLSLDPPLGGAHQFGDLQPVGTGKDFDGAYRRALPAHLHVQDGVVNVIDPVGQFANGPVPFDAQIGQHGANRLS